MRMDKTAAGKGSLQTAPGMVPEGIFTMTFTRGEISQRKEQVPIDSTDMEV